MYNPLPLLTPGLLDSELAKGKRWFVRQTYPRGRSAGLKAAVVIRAYPEDEENLARQHLALIQNDKNAFLYDTNTAEHLERLKKAAKQPTGYGIFYVGRKGVEWDPPDEYEQKVRHYIRKQHPAWIPQKATIEVGLYEEFGQLLLKFSYKSEEDTIPLDLIERY